MAFKNCERCFTSEWEEPDLALENVEILASYRDSGEFVSIEEEAVPEGPRASLVIVGLGLRGPGQLTDEARSAIASAGQVYYTTDDGPAGAVEDFESAIRGLKPGSEPLAGGGGGSLIEELEGRIGIVLAALSSGVNVCLVTQGHPAASATHSPMS